MFTSLILIFSLMLKFTLALKCYSCSDMNLPYGNDNWYVDPEYNVCNHGNGELVECNGTCMAAVGEGGRKFCYTECPNNRVPLENSRTLPLLP